MSDPPKKPWKRGVHGKIKVTHIRVVVCEDENGFVWSDHDFEDPEDRETALAMQNTGERQIAFGLATEAFRREMFACALVEMSRDPKYLKTFMDGDEDARSAIALRLGSAGQTVLVETLRKERLNLATEILLMLEAWSREGGRG
jgi:hypothetical protein